MPSILENWCSAMDNYIPFLKLKSNEVMAIKTLAPDVKTKITPFFDVPRKDGLTENDFVNAVGKLERSVSNNLNDVPVFYLDNFDVPSNLSVNGDHNYKFVVETFSNHSFIPVVSIDRDAGHIAAVHDGKTNGIIESDVIALRLLQEDFENFEASNEDIDELLSDVINLFDNVDLVLDCRVCSSLNSDEVAEQISNFSIAFADHYELRKTVVTGSSIPASIGDLLDVQTYGEFDRNELTIFRKVRDLSDDDNDLYLGDYCVVTPNYSDASIPGYALLNVMTPKIIYSFADKHFVIRGGAIRTHPRGNKQYNDFSQTIVGGGHYRGAAYSDGDKFIDEKSRSIGSSVMPGTIIKPTVNAHITYMVKDFH